MKQKRNKRFKLSLLVLLIAVPLLSPIGDKVLCISPSLDHFSVEPWHQETRHAAHGHTAVVEESVVSDYCGHPHCIDIPITNSLIATLTKAQFPAKIFGIFKNLSETNGSTFNSSNMVDSLESLQLVRVASLPQTSAHFLFMLVRVIVLLN